MFTYVHHKEKTECCCLRTHAVRKCRGTSPFLIMIYVQRPSQQRAMRAKTKAACCLRAIPSPRPLEGRHSRRPCAQALPRIRTGNMQAHTQRHLGIKRCFDVRTCKSRRIYRQEVLERIRIVYYDHHSCHLFHAAHAHVQAGSRLGGSPRAGR